MLLLIVILGQGAKLVGSLNQPFNLKLGFNKQFSWDQKTSINVVFAQVNSANQSYNVISFYPNDKKTVVLHLSDQIYINLPKSYGSWRLGSIYNLGQEEKPSIGPELLKQSLSGLLGLPIDGIVIAKDPKQKFDAESLIEKWHKNPFSLITSLNQVKTDLSLLETINLFRALGQVRSDKVVSLDLAKSTITESQLLADSSRVLGVDTVKLDYFIRENMADSSILDEGSPIAIFNATDHSGLAQEASRIVTNMGGTVVTSQTLDTHSDKSLVILSDRPDLSGKKVNLTSQRLTQIFAPDCLNGDCFLNDSKITNSRARINLILGEDFYNLWHKR